MTIAKGKTRATAAVATDFVGDAVERTDRKFFFVLTLLIAKNLPLSVKNQSPRLCCLDNLIRFLREKLELTAKGIIP